MTVSLGYNWVTSAGEQNRISARFNNNGVAGPIIDYEAQDVEVALLYDAEFGSGILYVKQAGAWVAYGSADCPDPYAATFGITQGGNQDADLYIRELFIAKPNIIAIGDSVTEGATLYAPDPAEGLNDYSSTWMAYAQIYGNVRNSVIVNKGIGSQTSAQVEARMASVMTDATPQVVFLSACNNDYGGGPGVDPAVRSANIQSSVDTIVGAGAKVALYNAVYQSTDNANYPDNGDYFRNWWDTESAGIENVDIKIDWMQGTIMDGNYMDATYTQADGVHPNPTGYALLGNYIESLEP
jgi:lysophospholipase L1-like esterase